jgi:nuclear transport factor 2 (NTF2) superfamily protein
MRPPRVLFVETNTILKVYFAEETWNSRDEIIGAPRRARRA